MRVYIIIIIIIIMWPRTNCKPCIRTAVTYYFTFYNNIMYNSSVGRCNKTNSAAGPRRSGINNNI